MGFQLFGQSGSFLAAVKKNWTDYKHLLRLFLSRFLEQKISLNLIAVHSLFLFVYFLTHRFFPLKDILHGVPTVSLQSNVEGSEESILLHQVLHHAVVLFPEHIHLNFKQKVQSK